MPTLPRRLHGPCSCSAGPRYPDRSIVVMSLSVTCIIKAKVQPQAPKTIPKSLMLPTRGAWAVLLSVISGDDDEQQPAEVAGRHKTSQARSQRSQSKLRNVQEMNIGIGQEGLEPISTQRADRPTIRRSWEHDGRNAHGIVGNGDIQVSLLSFCSFIWASVLVLVIVYIANDDWL